MKTLLRFIQALAPWQRAYTAFLCAAGIACLMALGSLGPPQETVRPLAGEAMRHIEGFAYGAPLDRQGPGAFLELSPVLLEDGVMQHATPAFSGRIGTLGQGRYRAESGHLVFSASGNDDPRSNGKQYALVERRIPLGTAPAWLLAAVAALVAVLVLGLCYRRQWRAQLALAVGVVTVFPLVCAGVLAAGYALSIAWALGSGQAMPVSAPFRSWPWTRGLIAFEPYLPHFCLSLAAAGVTLAWLWRLKWADARLSRGAAAVAARVLKRLGLPLCCCLLLYSLGSIWGGAITGHTRMEERDSIPVAGLALINTARLYFDNIHQADTGRWSPPTSWRAIGGAMRSAQAFVTGQNHQATLMLQALLLACVGFLAARTVARWRGVWAGVAFFALLHLVIRPHLANYLSEPGGLILACLGCVGLCGFFRSPSLPLQALCMAGVTLSQLLRPAAVLCVPVLACWFAWRARPDWSRVARSLCVSGLVILAGLTLQYTLSVWYGFPKGFAAEYGAFSASGDIGSLGDSLDKQTQQMVTPDTMTPDTTQQPGETVAARIPRLIKRAAQGLPLLPLVIIQAVLYGSGATAFPLWLLAALAPVGLFGMAWTFLRCRTPGEMTLWAGVMGAILACAALLYQIDGQRTFMSSYPLMWVLMASGFCAPPALLRAGAAGRAPEAAWASWALAGLVAACLLGPALAHVLWKPTPGIQDPPKAGDTFWLRGGRPLLGFLIIPEGNAPPPDVPSMPRETFLRLTTESSIPAARRLAAASAPETATAFICAYAPEKDHPGRYYAAYILCPAEVLTRKDVPYWRLRLESKAEATDAFDIWQVRQAEPAIAP